MNTNDVARIAGLIGEPSRTAMLLELLDGRALTAAELARAARVQPPAASRHLALLAEAGLLRVEPHGRHRYHRLASAEVARTLERLMQLGGGDDRRGRSVVTGPREAAMRRARLCYDHLAGRLAVAIAERLQGDGSVVVEGDSARLGPAAERTLGELGIALATPAGGASQRRPACRPCLDWSERRCHLAGALGALICAHCLERRWLVRRAGGRTLDITAPGQLALRSWLGAEAWSRVA